MDSNPLGTDTINGTTSPVDSIPVGTKTPEPTPLARTTESPEQKGKALVPGDPDIDPALSESSSKKSNSPNDSSSSKSN